ncbi:MAG: ABC transporter permease [Muribaculaceae bacterium]|nr:ABC transporter permease [Muribaculaceae bacterium]
MKLEAGIAWRYLWKKKSHGAVSAIAVISVVGVAVATAALICVLSVFNGFRNVLTEQSDLILPDVEILPVSGKTISDADSLADAISKIPGVELASAAIADQALAIFAQREMPIILRGVNPAAFRSYTTIDSLIVGGSPMPRDAIDRNPPAGLISVGVASRLQTFDPGDRVFLFAPRREGRINLANPAASFLTDSLEVSGIFESHQTDYDTSTVYVPIEVARGLFGYETQASSVAVKVAAGADATEVARRIGDAIGVGYVVKDRMRQQEVSFRMVQIEKWVTGLLLLFILVIASFNIISTMTMFVLEKRRQMLTFRALGMERGSIGAIFGWESLYITLLGGLCGIALGVALCLLQQHYGLIRMQGGEGSLLVQAYPVQLIWSDLWMAAIPIVVIGAVTARIAASFARSRIAETRQ